MTFGEIEDQFPDGFHDCQITGLAFDIVSQIVRLSVNVDESSVDDVMPSYRQIVVTATGVQLFLLERPSPTYPFLLDGRAVSASGDDGLQGLDDQMEAVIKRLPEGTNCYRFFLYDSNSFLYIGAQDATYESIK